MPIGSVPPPVPNPDDSPLVCVAINREWIPIILGALQPLKYPEYWGGTLEENRKARRDFGVLINQFMIEEDCGMASNCCVDVQVIQRVDVTTGSVQVSYDGGGTWVPKPKSFETTIVNPPPPVTSGVAATKCDAAQNVATQIDDWIDHVGTAFDVAVTLFEFATLIVGAIVNAVLLILSAGALSAAELEIIGIISAAMIAVWNGGKALFVDYWTSENKDIIFCAAYCHIGDDGSFNQAQFAEFYSQVGHELPSGVAKTLFMGFMSSVGASGMSAMAASGLAADSDCLDCNCTDACSIAGWTPADENSGIIDPLTHTANFMQIESQIRGDGKYYVILLGASADDCCEISVAADNSGMLYLVSGTPNISNYNACGTAPSGVVGGGAIGIGFGTFNMNAILYRGDATFTIAIDTTR